MRGGKSIQHRNGSANTASVLRVVLIIGCVLLSTISALATEPPITALVFAPEGKQVVAVSQAGVQIFDWPGLELVRTIGSTAANLHDVAFSPDGNQLAIGGGNPAQDGVVQLFDWPAGNLLNSVQPHEDSVRAVAWLSDSMLLSASLDRTIQQWDLSQEKPARVVSLDGHSRGVADLLLLTDGKTLVSAGDDQSVRVWNLETHELIRSLNQHTQPINDLALRPKDGGLPMIASAAGDRTIRFWQPTIGRMVRYIRLDSEPLSIVWIDESRIAAACVDGHVRITDVDELQVLQDLPTIDGWAYAIAVHPTDGTMVVGGSNGKIQTVTVNKTLTVE